MVASSNRRWWALALSQRRPVHDRARHRDRERRPSFDPGGPRVLAGEPAVGDQRVRARLRRLPAARRARGRHRRPAASVHRRSRGVHRGVAPRGVRVERAVADRRPGAPGPRRGDHRPGGSLDPDDDLLRGQGAQHRARRLGSGRRVRRGRRRADGRHLHRRPQLGVDLPHQPAGRARRDGARAGPARREP